jgi:hypothetical protein
MIGVVLGSRNRIGEEAFENDRERIMGPVLTLTV